MPASPPATAATTRLTSMRLPNGASVLQLNPAETSLMYRDIVATRAYLQYGLRIAPGDVVIDVGANIGLSALFFHWEAPGVRVICVEPVPELYAALEANLGEHGVDAVALCAGLSDAAGETTLSYYPATTVMTSRYANAEHDSEVTRTFLRNSGFGEDDVQALAAGRHAQEQVDCRLTTVSALLDEHAIERVALLKINVEKAEADVLAGIRPEHWERIDQLTMQVHDLGGRVAAVRADIEARGYVVTVDQDPLLDGTDIFDLFARRPGGQP